MTRLVAAAALVIYICLPTQALGQSLTGIRIEGPTEVIEQTTSLYSVIAEFDNGLEFDVTLSSFLRLEPGIDATISVFAKMSAADVNVDTIEEHVPNVVEKERFSPGANHGGRLREEKQSQKGEPRCRKLTRSERRNRAVIQLVWSRLPTY